VGFECMFAFVTGGVFAVCFFVFHYHHLCVCVIGNVICAIFLTERDDGLKKRRTIDHVSSNIDFCIGMYFF
jgi:hypothetical protein